MNSEEFSERHVAHGSGPVQYFAVVITIHGTHDAAAPDDGFRWWQRGSPFLASLATELSAAGHAAPRIVPFHWNGLNSEAARQAAARDLIRLARRVRRVAPEANLHLIAHSHGGNVLVSALRLGLTAQLGPGSTLTCLGTPFFPTRRKLDSWTNDAIQGSLLGGLAIGLWIALGWQSFLIAAVAGVMAMGGLSRRAGAFPDDSEPCPPLLCIWSVWDEAIRGLAALEQVHVTPITAAYVASNTRRLVKLVTAFAAAFAFAVLFTLNFVTASDLAFLHRVVFFLLEGSLVFIVAFAAAAVLEAAVPRLVHWSGAAWLIARIANRILRRLLVAAAYGDDHDDRLRAPQPTPRWPRSIEYVVEDEAVGTVSRARATAAVVQSYEDLMGFGGAMAEHQTIWQRLSQSLYHNAYFEDVRVSKAISQSILGAASTRATQFRAAGQPTNSAQSNDLG